jgi:hypothetical protein
LSSVGFQEEVVEYWFMCCFVKSDEVLDLNPVLTNFGNVKAGEPQQLESIHADNEDARGSQHDS